MYISEREGCVGIDVVVQDGDNWDVLIAERHWFVCSFGSTRPTAFISEMRNMGQLYFVYSRMIFSGDYTLLSNYICKYSACEKRYLITEAWRGSSI